MYEIAKLIIIKQLPFWHKERLLKTVKLNKNIYDYDPKNHSQNKGRFLKFQYKYMKIMKLRKLITWQLKLQTQNILFI